MSATALVPARAKPIKVEVAHVEIKSDRPIITLTKSDVYNASVVLAAMNQLLMADGHSLATLVRKLVKDAYGMDVDLNVDIDVVDDEPVAA